MCFKKLHTIALVLFALLLPTTAAATDGKELLRGCEVAIKSLEQSYFPNASEAVDAGTCLGVVETTALALQVLDRQQEVVAACVPFEDLSYEQLLRAVLAYLRDNQAELNRRAMFLVMKALKEAFPCNQ